jgi:hypothetical protein
MKREVWNGKFMEAGACQPVTFAGIQPYHFNGGGSEPLLTGGTACKVIHLYILFDYLLTDGPNRFDR